MKILVGYKGPDIGRDLLDLAIHRIKAIPARFLSLRLFSGTTKQTREMLLKRRKISTMHEITLMNRE